MFLAMVAPNEEIILQLCNVSFNYPRTTKTCSEKVLNNISLSVRQAEIYGLLGASGCGKTTLLRLILGRLCSSKAGGSQWATCFSGSMYLFGERMNVGENGWLSQPSPQDIGYMPQDIVLYDEFTSTEMLQYFGQLYQMSKSNIEKRILHLLKLLELDDKAKLLGQLSGGQRRRVSLAIALLHQPRLLILDEPTVGVDPLLREVIWNHLNYLTKVKRNTVILTTHYIEEARYAQMIGFLRNGRLLIQSEPDLLLQRYQVDTMEQVFLQLCKENTRWQKKTEQLFGKANSKLSQYQKRKNAIDWTSLMPSTAALVSSTTSDLTFLPQTTTTNQNHRSIQPNQTISSQNQIDGSVSIIEMAPSLMIQNKTHPISKDKNIKNSSFGNRNHHSICWIHLKTLIRKNFRQVYRQISLLMFFILLPAIEMALIMLCIGRDINHIPIAVYNAEHPRPDLSQVFLDSFEQDAFELKYFNTAIDAYRAVKENRAAAMLHFSSRFSIALRSRFFSFGFMDDDDSNSTMQSIWNDSSVYVQLDMSNQLIGLQIQRQLLNGFLNFAQRLAMSLGLSNHTFKPPISFGPPVYGIQTSAVVETFIAPGALIMIAFFATTIVTCHLLIHEIRQQLIERALIAGASTAEFLFSHIIIQSVILMIQLSLVLLTAFRLFHMPYLGSLSLSIALVCLQGICGLMYGLMLSATCPDEIYATTLAIGTFFPSVIIGGIFWPVESMPLPLQYLSQCLPSTQSIDALRYILLRNWDLKHTSVALAFLVSSSWMFMFMFCALRNFKKRI